MRSAKLYVVLGSAVAFAVLVLLLVWTPRTRHRQDLQRPLVLYCAAGVNPPVAQIVKNYQDEVGVTVSVQYGGSGTLLSNLRVAQTGDLYLAADASYIQIAREQGLIAETIL